MLDWLKLALFAGISAAGTAVMLLGTPPTPQVKCFAGVVAETTDTSITIVPKRRPEMVNDTVFVVPLHPWVLVCTDFQSVKPPAVSG